MLIDAARRSIRLQEKRDASESFLAVLSHSDNKTVTVPLLDTTQPPVADISECNVL